jgi:hypothetical protein
MTRLCSLLLAATFLSYAWAIGQGQARPQPPPQPPPPQYGQPPADLANALVQMARASHVPIIAELVWPLPKIPTAEGKPLNPGTLNELVKQAPGYEWKMEGKAIHFYNKKLRNARFNFLNLKFPRFTIPPDLSDLKLWLPGRAEGLLEGYTGEGGATSGFGDTLLGKQKLQRVTLENVTPLEVLVHVANESPTFYTVLVFPSAAPTKDEAEKRVVWQWGSLNEKLQPVYTQPPLRQMTVDRGAGVRPFSRRVANIYPARNVAGVNIGRVTTGGAPLLALFEKWAATESDTATVRVLRRGGPH